MEPFEFPHGHWLKRDVDRLLLWLVKNKASDLCVVPSTSLRARIFGKWVLISKDPALHDSVVLPMIQHLTLGSSNSWTRIMGGEFLDMAYSVKDPLNKFNEYFFRINITGCKDTGGNSASIVIRTIPGTVPKLDDLSMEKDIIDIMAPKNGLVLITGVMGSGKSTSLAAMIRHMMENDNRHIVTFESPIEFDLMQLNEDPLCQRGGMIIQSEVGSHIRSFEVAPMNTTRRAPDVALYGEIRDPSTIAGAIEQAEVGTLVYATVHTSSVSSTPVRMVNVFSSEERSAKASALIASLRLIMHQRLIPTLDGGRAAAREWLSFESDIRDHMLMSPQTQWSKISEEALHERGRPLLESMKILYDEGRISKKEVEFVEVEKSRTIE